MNEFPQLNNQSLFTVAPMVSGVKTIPQVSRNISVSNNTQMRMTTPRLPQQSKTVSMSLGQIGTNQIQSISKIDSSQGKLAYQNLAMKSSSSVTGTSRLAKLTMSMQPAENSNSTLRSSIVPPVMSAQQNTPSFSTNSLNMDVNRARFGAQPFMITGQRPSAYTRNISMSATAVDEEIKAQPNALRWDHTPEEIGTLTDSSLVDWKATIDEVINVKEPRTFKNTIEPLSTLDHNQELISNNIQFYTYMSTSKELRDASVAATKKMQDFSIELMLNYDFYQAVKNYKEAALESKEWDSLDAESQRYVDKTLLDFDRNGMKYPQEKRDIIKALLTEMSDLERDAQININNDMTKCEFEVKDLEGLPDPILTKLEKVPEKEGHVYVSMQYPEVIPALMLCKNEETRRVLAEAYGRRCIDENIPKLEELVPKRQQFSELLEYASYSEYILEERMAKNPNNVQDFIQSLITKLQKSGQEEKDRLEKLKQDETGNPDAVLEPWDRSFYLNVLKEKFYQIDEEKIKEYFPTTHVVDTTMEIYQELLGLKFQKVEGLELWHEDASCYEVKDAKSGDIFGHFYLDLHPRENKFSHAAVFPLVHSATINGKRERAAAAMLCNFDKPTPERASLLPHGDVVTFFHEFGHVMHGMCSQANYTRFSGTSVERDFVELPSQMLENWVWDKDVLKRLSKHFESGEPLPDDIIEKKISIKNLQGATFNLRQLFNASFDFILHSANDEKMLKHEYLQDQFQLGQLRKDIKKDGQKIDTHDLWHTLAKAITLGPAQDKTNGAASFGHIYGGYQSQYYGYLWSQVYSCDLFQEFEKHGIMNPELGMKYRNVILGPGGSRDSNISLKEFLGREPNDEAFMRMNGFATA